MKTKNKKSILDLSLLPLQNTHAVIGGDPKPKIINVGNSIVDDLNGLIR